MQRYKETFLILILLIIAIAFGVSKLQPIALNLYHTEKGIKQKQAELADLDRQVEALKAAEVKEQTQLAGQAKKIYKPGETGLDTESSFTVIFDDLIEMAKYNQVKIYSIGYAYNPEDDAFVKGAPDKYNVCKVNLQLIADYVDLDGLLKDLYKYPYLVNIDEIELKPYQKNKKILLINLQLKLYAEK